MHWCTIGHRNIGLIDFSLLGRGQFDLRALGRGLNTLQRYGVLSQIQTVDLLEFFDNVIDQTLIEVFAAKEGIAIGGEHFKLHFTIDIGDFDDGDIESTATQIVDSNLAITLAALVQTKRQRCGGRLVDDALDIQTRDTAGIFGGLTLRVVEISRHSNDSLGDFFTEIVFGSLFHLAQDFSRNLRRREFFVAHGNPRVTVISLHDFVGHESDVFLDFFLVEFTANQTLDSKQCVSGVGDRLTFRRCANQNFTVFLVRDDRRRCTCAFRILDNLGLAAFHDGDAGIGGSEVNANDLAHDVMSLQKLIR